MLIKSQHSARDRVLDAAIELFATQGFQSIGLRDLASYVGLHAGSLYHHIESKQSLLFELIESALSDLLLDTTRRMKGARSPQKRLLLFIQAFAAFSCNEKHRLTLITREFFNLNQEQKQQILQLKDRYSSALCTIIRDVGGAEGKHSAAPCPTTNALIVLLFGQSQWYGTETTEVRLTETLTALASSIIASSRKTEVTTMLHAGLPCSRAR
ncbi:MULTISPECIES: TetR/AcrR family transcriptional regulator [unclassified Pseudomonas]|jgi:AcrR family transcriptional regulator|uniref:TetR/AcrR family transcriptional regulator n=1 Tax=unclassified Pseudomonas TaxID=196821 RepID=UPI00069D23B2|nr:MULTISPECIES: TetR/AcrR family transcriptional regulator [unclassified Pseudomonas]WPN45560.1 TetR/AcrR family transcriptional regulator [Pseudomonas sp. P8_241]